MPTLPEKEQGILSEELDSQLAVIESGEWREAVFTTYALSLTFFESCLLPALRRARCEKATIFTDVDGYRSSLMERRSASAGREYLVVPVEVGSGIFHPKCTYLVGDKKDALLIGSGNLTFGGHGKNVEVLETLFSDSHPHCFLDFADFIVSILARDDVLIADRVALDRLEKQARHVGRRVEGLSRNGVELIYSTNESVAGQLRERLSLVGPVKQLLVLSPYHHPAGTPIQQLLTVTGAKELLVGVPSDASATSFPIDVAKSWDVVVDFVRPKVIDKRRGLHAKWWEIRGRQSVLSLTGSINATNESFSTTHNIEIGVLRLLKKPLAEKWETIKAPRCEPNDFHRSATPVSGVLFATVNSEGRVKGQVLGVDDPEGEWQLVVEDDAFESRMLSVDSNGAVAWRDSKLLTATHTLQLELQRGADIARGWLSNEAVLRMPSRARAVAQAVVRMLMREETADDIDAMFDYIAIETASAISEAMPLAGKLTTTPKQGLPGDETIHIREFEFAGSSSEERLLHALATGELNPAHRLSVLDSIVAILMGRKGGTTAGVDSASVTRKPTGGHDAEDDDEVALQAEKESALERFNAAMDANIKDAPVTGRLLGIALRIWLYVNLDMQLRRLGSTEAAWLFASQWLSRVRMVRMDKESREILAESFCGLVGGLLARNLERLGDDIASREKGMTARAVHDWLEQFFHGTAEPENISALAKRWADHDVAHLMLVGTRTTPELALQIALKEPTARQTLESVVTAHRAGRQFDIPNNRFSRDVETVIGLMQRSAPEKPIFKTVQGGLPSGCPKCHLSLIANSLTQLRVNRLVECLNCHTIIVWLGVNDENR